MVKLIFIAPKLNRAGLQNHLLELCKLLDKNKYEIWICVLSKEKGELEDEFKKIGVNLLAVSYNSLFPLIFMFKIYKFFNKINPHILHIHDISIPGCIIALTGKLSRVKSIIFTIHGMWAFKGLRKIYFKILFNFTQKISNKFIAVSKACRDYWVRNFNLHLEKTSVIYNGIDIDKFAFQPECKVRKKLNFPKSFILIGSIGRLIPYKNHILLIKSLPFILKKYPNTIVILIGSGELREKLEEEVREKKLENNFLFLGIRSDIPDLLKEIDIFVFPSITLKYTDEKRIGEAFGIVVLEAMATGKPVIALNTGGIPEIIENNKNGILLHDADPQLLANTIVELIQNKEKRIKIGMEARKTVEKRFTTVIMVKKIEKVYEELLNKNR